MKEKRTPRLLSLALAVCLSMGLALPASAADSSGPQPAYQGDGYYITVELYGNQELRLTEYSLFSDGLVNVGIGPSREDAFADKDGNVVLSYENLGGRGYIPVGDFHEGLCAVRVPEAGFYADHGYIDKSGRLVIPPQFSEAGDFSGGLALVEFEEGQYDGHWGYINTAGDVVFVAPLNHVGHSWDYADGYSTFGEGKAMIYVDSRNDETYQYFYRLVDENGNELGEYENGDGLEFNGRYSEGYLVCCVPGGTEDDTVLILDEDLNEVWSGPYSPGGSNAFPGIRGENMPWNVCNGLVALYPSIGTGGIFDVEAEEFLVEPVDGVYFADDFSDGLMTAYQNGSYYRSAVMDTTGQYVIPMGDFEWIGPFNEGLAVAEYDGQYYLLEKHEGTWSGQPEPEPEEPAQTFTDVTPDKWYYDFVETVAEKGLFAGNGDGTFAPENNMTYAEFLAVLFQFSGDTLPANSGPNWYDNHVQWAKNSGVIPSAMLAGFAPEAAITRQDMAALFGSFLTRYDYSAAPVNSGTPSFSDEGGIAGYAKDGVELCYQLGIMGGNSDGTFAPDNNAIRAEVAVTMVQMARVMGR